jgi:hypothetical protein
MSIAKTIAYHALACLTATLVQVPAAAADLPSLSCRAQVIAFCDTKCEFNTGPADLSLNLPGGMISYCRGEQCDDGKIVVQEAEGQWNNEPYVSFEGTVDRGGRVWGMVSLKSLTFYAMGDAGDMFGTCEVK